MKKRNFVSIRTKTITILATILFLLIFGTSIILNNIMIKQIVKLEQDRIAEDILRTQNTIVKQIDNLYNTAYDWAVWDDTYKFITDKNEQYTKSNLVPEIFANLDINLMVYVNASGTIVYESGFDKTEQKFTPVSSSINEFLIHSSILKNIDPNFNIKGIINLPEGPMIIASSPILKSNEEGPVLGNFIVGFYFDEVYIKDLEDQLNLQLSISPYTKSINENKNLGSDTIIYHNISDNLIEASFVLNDINGQPVSQLTLQKDRAIYQLGKSGVNAVSAYIGLLSGLCILILSIYMRQSILLKLRYISNEIWSIGKKADFSRRLKPQVINDEFGIVSDEINSMLASLQEANEKSEYNSNHDFLTNLLNRRGLTTLLNEWVESEAEFMVCCINLENFKYYNDLKGYDFGDQILIELSNLFKQIESETIIVSRFIGNEFVIGCQSENLDVMNNLITSITQIFEKDITVDLFKCHLSAAIGISIFPIDGLNVDEIIKNSEIAMYEAKRSVSTKVIYWNQKLKNEFRYTIGVVEQLKNCIAQDEFEMVYQPQVNNVDASIVSLEGLLRMKGSKLSPGIFIPIAEKNGLMNQMGRIVISKVIEQIAAWRDLGFQTIPVYINLSPTQLHDQTLSTFIENLLKQYKVEPALLGVEITEEVFIGNESFIISTLQKLKDLGLRTAIDDFGSGQAGIKYLTKYEIDIVKIDKDIADKYLNEKYSNVYSIIVELCKVLGFQVLAEGIETIEQVNFLKKMDVDRIQGYYYHKPLSVKDIESKLNKI